MNDLLVCIFINRLLNFLIQLCTRVENDFVTLKKLLKPFLLLFVTGKCSYAPQKLATLKCDTYFGIGAIQQFITSWPVPNFFFKNHSTLLCTVPFFASNELDRLFYSALNSPSKQQLTVSKH